MTSRPRFGGAYGGTPTASTPLTPEEIARRGNKTIADLPPPNEGLDVPARGDFWIYIVDPHDGILKPLTYKDAIDQGWLPPGLTPNEINGMIMDVQRQYDDAYWGISSGGGGGGRGGGAVGPTYVKPDERVVRDAIKSKLALLVGNADDALVDKYTEMYMTEAQRKFDLRESEDINPMQSVLEAIRGQADYQKIHAMRPDSVDEDTWVSSRQGALIRAGVTPELAAKLGVKMATVGASSDQQLSQAAGYAVMESSGQSLEWLRNRYKQSAYAAASLV